MDISADRWIHAARRGHGLPRVLEARRCADEARAEGFGRRHDRHDAPVGHEGRAALGIGLGPMGFGPGGRLPFGRGPKARRGDVRAAALVLLTESPANGYQLMQEIESRSQGMWRPSPGSMYPVLQQLEDEGLVAPEGPEGRRVHALTEAGRRYVVEHAAQLGTPWAAAAESAGGDRAAYWQSVVQTAAAARQVFSAGTPRQQAEAKAVLVETRRALYRILAEDASEGGR